MIAVWNQMDLVMRLQMITVVLGALPATVYPFILASVRWNKSNIGRSMMFKGLALLLVFDVGVASLFFYTQSWFDWFRLVVNVFLMFAVTYQVHVVRCVIRDGELSRRIGKSTRRE